MKSTTKQWAWGPTAHWKLYFSLKRFSKKFYYNVSSGVESRSNYSTSSEGSRNEVLTNNNNRRLCSKPRKLKSRTSSLVRCFSSSSSCASSSRNDLFLSNDQINQAIWKNENVIYFDSQGLRCETNQLASNQPNEDQLFVTRSYLNEGDVLVGVIDGHGGSTLGKVIKARLPYYLHSSLCDKQMYVKHALTPSHLVENMLDDGENEFSLNDDYWMENLDQYMTELINNNKELTSYVTELRNFLSGHTIYQEQYNSPYENITDAIRKAFLRLDNDLIKEVRLLSDSNQLDSENLGLALSGCCALVAYILEDELFIANSGDCRAILGTNTNGVWSSVQLTCDHTAAANSEEVRRILSEHPIEESRSCIQYGRLLGRLAPLRAFGDIQFKLSAEELQNIFRTLPNYKILPGLRSPPYLTAEPDVFHYKLESSDKFVVLASDGLWDMLSNDEVIELVAAYIEGTKIDMLKERAHLFGVANCHDIISDPNAFTDSSDENVASFLIRFALGGYDQENLRSMLALPYPDVRLYRDDITVSVIFLNRL